MLSMRESPESCLWPGPPTASGFSGIEPARQLLGLWPTLVRRDLVEPEIKVSLQETAL